MASAAATLVVPAVMLTGGPVAAATTAAGGPAPSYQALELPAGFLPSSMTSGGLVVGSIPAPAGSAEPSYSQLYDLATAGLTDLGPVSGGGRFIGYHANNLRQAVGQIWDNPTGVRPDLYLRNSDGTVVDLGPMVGKVSNASSAAVAVNDAGQVVGQSLYSGSMCDGVAFAGTATSGWVGLGSLTPPPAIYGWTYASGQNNLGQVVGRSSPAGACLPSDTVDAFVYSPAGGMRDLATASGMPAPRAGNGSRATAVNDNGIAVGMYPAGYSATVNRLGLYIPLYHAVVWDTSANTYIDLGDTGVASALYDINAAGVVVGLNGGHAAVGVVTGGRLSDLNLLATGLGAGVVLTTATGVDAAGDILASGVDAAGASHYYLLKPGTALPPPLPPTAPTGLSVGSATRTTLVLHWNDTSSNEQSFLVERCRGTGCTSFVQVASVGAGVTSWSDSGLTRNTGYSYRVRAVDDAGASGYAGPVSAKTLK